ncbi:MAG: hypothetical protein EOO17_03635 [Chloroflexi bacterium]|nr:MAG: hypothetical protein EOO17_03635 [Chloroflexota bacterium]
MLDRKLKGLNASTLRLLLALSIVALLAVGVGLFVFAFQKLKESATDVQTINAQAASSSDNLTALRTLETKLGESAQSIQRAKDIVAESKSYEYQDKIIADLEAYAVASRLSVSSYSFAAGEGSAASGGAPVTPAPATPAPGLKSTTISLALAGGSNYENLMTFINYIEQNLTKMQLSGVSLTRDDQTNAITSGELTIEVYIR